MGMTKKKVMTFILIVCLMNINMFGGSVLSAETISISSEPYADGGEILSEGLDLSAMDDPDVRTRYTAGEGFIYWDPDSGSLTFHNADVVVEEIARTFA